MKIVIFGLGSIGQRYVRLLGENLDHEIFAFRSKVKREKNLFNIKELDDWQGLNEVKADVAFVTNPTSFHVETALRCASLGMHLFIEKPLSNTLQGIDQLESICRQGKLTCYTAYCLRFHPVIKKIKELSQGKELYHARVVCSSYLPHWRPDQNHRLNYSASRKMGGGVVLELSHEFDYVQYLFGEIRNVISQSGRQAEITMDAEDYVDVILKLDGNLPVNVHLNFLSRWNERSIKIDFKDGYIHADFLSGQMTYLFHEEREEFQYPLERDALFIEQLKYFFRNLNNPSIMNNLQESKRLLKVLLAIKA